MSKSNLHKKIGQAGWSNEHHTERNEEKAFYKYDCLEKPSTGKSKSKRKHTTKVKHKHDYEDIICVYHTRCLENLYSHAVLRKRCKICGKVDGWIHPTIKDPICCGSRMMTFEETMNIYYGLEIINYD